MSLIIIVELSKRSLINIANSELTTYMNQLATKPSTYVTLLRSNYREINILLRGEVTASPNTYLAKIHMES